MIEHIGGSFNVVLDGELGKNSFQTVYGAVGSKSFPAMLYFFISAICYLCRSIVLFYISIFASFFAIVS